jgi:hypothetical protein
MVVRGVDSIERIPSKSPAERAVLVQPAASTMRYPHAMHATARGTGARGATRVPLELPVAARNPERSMSRY